ncbi:hypothetical protein [Leyella stercorea]|uniref:hypothetical protein n=1 Tax=Leyella stercorea TaxID=363265 RepID=UPI000A83201A|nr:hypothetical protein [Leyella stercorea]
MLVTVDADAFLTTSTSQHHNIKSHHLTTSTSQHQISTPQHLTTSPSINNNGKVDIPSTLPLSLK